MPVYVAKPAVVPTVPAWPDIPIGWNPDWEWPSRANPPGYAVPEAAISLSSGAATMPGTSVTASASWMAAGLDGPVGLPPGDWTQVWTAKLEGVALPLKVSGDPSFSSSLVSGYDIVGIYYGVEEDIEFDISLEDAGKTITLSVESVVDGETYTDTAEIVIAEPTGWSKIYGELVCDGEVDWWLITAHVEVSASGGSTLEATFASGEWAFDGTGAFSDWANDWGLVDADLIASQIQSLDGQTLTLSASVQVPEGAASANVTFEPSTNFGIFLYGELSQASTSLSLSAPPGGSDEDLDAFCTIDGNTVTSA